MDIKTGKITSETLKEVYRDAPIIGEIFWKVDKE